MSSVIEKLAYSQGRRDEVPNVKLAVDIHKKKDLKSIAILVEHLADKNVHIQTDCIKVLYEIANLQADLIAKYYSIFLELLRSKNNRIQWGAMTALSSIVNEKPKEIFDNLILILDCAEKGTVITKDHAAKIMSELAKKTTYRTKILPLYFEFMLKAPDNQFPSYAEFILPAINYTHANTFSNILQDRKMELKKDSSQKKVQRILHKVMKLSSNLKL